MRVLRPLAAAGCLLLAASTAACTSGAEPQAETSPGRVVQLGAPGASPTEVSPGDPAPSGQPYSSADVAFVQGMLHHHAQALEMTALVEERTDNEQLALMTERMDISQKDEIAQMERWLTEREQEVPDAASHGGGHGGAHGDGHGDGHGEASAEASPGDAHGGQLMPGMLTEEQLADLAAASGAAFDRLFLQSMIVHHQGALVMVQELLDGGGGQETAVFQLAQHVGSDQAVEISRMKSVLADLPA